PAEVVRVIDGSTLDARMGGSRTAIGYLGARAPAANQTCGPEALARNQELAGTEVMLEEDPAYTLDEIDRRLYYVFTTDGISIDDVLVREGLAYASRPDAHYGPILAAAELDARQAQRGCLWTEAQPAS